MALHGSVGVSHGPMQDLASPRVNVVHMRRPNPLPAHELCRALPRTPNYRRQVSSCPESCQQLGAATRQCNSKHCTCKQECMQRVHACLHPTHLTVSGINHCSCMAHTLTHPYLLSLTLTCHRTPLPSTPHPPHSASTHDRPMCLFETQSHSSMS